MNRSLSSKDIILKFLPFLWQDKSFKIRVAIFIALALIPITVLLNIGLPILFRDIINKLSGQIKSSEQIVLVLIFSYGFFWTLNAIAEKLREMFFFKPILQAVTDYSLTVFKHLHALGLRFHLGRQTGKVTTAIEYSQLAITMVITNILFRIIPRILEVILAFLVIWYLYGSFYAAIMLGTIAVYICWSLFTSPIIMDRQREWMKVNDFAAARFVDGLLNFETTTYFNRHEYEMNTIKKLHVILDRTIIKLLSTTLLVQIVQSLIVGVGLILITYYAGKGVLAHTMRLGDFVLINGYLLQFLGPLYEVGMHIQRTKTALVDVEPSTELLMEHAETRDLQKLPPLILKKSKAPEISFENVFFSYQENVPALENLNFIIEPGSTAAIVGPSGSGKSTILRLILRFFDPTSGCIKIQHQNIQDLNPDSIRKIIGVVPQDIALFNDTLEYNLRYGNFKVTQNELEQILAITKLDTMVKQIPQGLDTLVGERGLKLSGGERQRIALARALLRHPAILIFDEATSSLDVMTEKAIQDNIAQSGSNTTSIMIAHRLSTIVNSDKILVLNQGRVVEQGRHHELLQHKGLYAALWYKQRVQEEERDNHDRIKDDRIKNDHSNDLHGSGDHAS